MQSSPTSTPTTTAAPAPHRIEDHNLCEVSASASAPAGVRETRARPVKFYFGAFSRALIMIMTPAWASARAASL